MRSLLLVTALAACGSVAERPDAAPPADSGMACPTPPVSFTHTAGSAGAARFHKLHLADHPMAVCNDGTPGVYTLRPGFGGGAKRWVIYLEGGGSCSTAADCAARDPGLMSSSAIVDGTVNPAAFRAFRSDDPADNPDFYDANFVQIEYCSSDGWSGAVAGSPLAETDDIRHWSFQGRAIVAAVLDELVAAGLAADHEVLFAGGSAGGVGVYNQLDDVRARLPAGVRLVGLADAGFILDYPAYDAATMRESTAMPTLIGAELAQSIEAWHGSGDASCEAAVTGAKRAQCRSPVFLAGNGHITTPLFIRQSQVDAVQLGRLIPPDTDPRAAPVDAYRGRFAAAMRGALGALPAGTPVFSTSNGQHVMITGPAWTTISVNGTALAAAIGAFYRDPCSAAPGIEAP